MWGVCLYAFFRGGKAEKVVALGILLNVYLSILAFAPFAARFRHVELPVMVLDTALIVLLLVVSLKSEKFWPLWLTAMQALGTLSHLAPLVPHMIPWGYGNAVALWMYPMLIVLGITIHRTHRDRQEHRPSTG